MMLATLGEGNRRHRTRQRRLMSKHFHRAETENGEVNSSFVVRLPLYFLYSLILFTYLYWGLVSSLLLSGLFLCLKRLKVLMGAMEVLGTTYKAYKARRLYLGPSFKEEALYYIDYWMSTTSYAKGLFLLGSTWCLILTSGTLISWMANEPWVESLWAAALGSGLDWGFINSTNPSLRLLAVCTNVGGLVLTALLLSIISDAVQTKYDSLRKGESAVTEEGHTLIVGWSVKWLSVMTQLSKSGHTTGSNVIVCLSNHQEKEDMETEIAHCEFNFAGAGTRVVCRSGSPLSYHDLKKVSFFQAKSIIILGDDEYDAEANDARSLQILLSIVSGMDREKAAHERRKPKNSTRSSVRVCPSRIVIEVTDTENAAIMKSVCPQLVETVLAHDVVGRLMLQAARNPLVADVWQDLLGFDGCETYSGQWGILRGLRFGEVLLCFEDGIPLGVKTASGALLLNPDDSYVIGDGDEIIVLAEDDDTYSASINHPLIREKIPDVNSPGGFRYNEICSGGLDAIRDFSRKWAVGPSFPGNQQTTRDVYGSSSEKVLYCGWRFDMGNLLQVFSAVAPKGSEFWILSETPIEQRKIELRLRGWEDRTRKVKVMHHIGAARRSVLAQLPLETFTSVIVGGSDSSIASKSTSKTKRSSDSNSHAKSEVVDEADARVITVVMMIQDIITRRNMENVKFGTQSSKKVELNKDEPLHFTCPALSSHERLVTAGISKSRSQRFLSSRHLVDALAPKGVVVGEIVDSRSRAMLTMVTSIDAVVASSELISKALAMVSEDRSVNRVLNTLFDPYDSEITLECVDGYVDVLNEKVSFFELMARGRDTGTIVMGYLAREVVQSVSDHHTIIRYTDVILNPAHKDVRRVWHPDDLLIVLTAGTDHKTLPTPSDLVSNVSKVRASKLIAMRSPVNEMSNIRHRTVRISENHGGVSKMNRERGMKF